MALIGKLIGKLLTKGNITLITPGKEPRTYGPGAVTDSPCAGSGATTASAITPIPRWARQRTGLLTYWPGAASPRVTGSFRCSAGYRNFTSRLSAP